MEEKFCGGDPPGMGPGADARKHKNLNSSTEGSRDDDSNTVVATVSPAVISAPRPVTGRRREAGFLASGSLLASSFPKLFELQWTRGRSLSGHSCGGSRGISPRSNLSPLREPCAWANHTGNRKPVNPISRTGPRDEPGDRP